jgi:hypothetical protein
MIRRSISGLPHFLLTALLLGTASTAHAGASCLLFPLSCLAPSHKYGDEVEATVLAINKKFTEAYARSFSDGTVTPSPLDNTREFYVTFQVGQTRYVAWKKDTVVQMAGVLGGYSPKREKWIGKPVKMRFEDESWMGLKTPVAAFKTPEGKEWKLVIVSIVGPDGVEECPPFFGLAVNDGHCKPQADVDRPKREAETLAKLQAQGKKPVWESAEGAALAESVRAKAGTDDLSATAGATSESATAGTIVSVSPATTAASAGTASDPVATAPTADPAAAGRPAD